MPSLEEARKKYREFKSVEEELVTVTSRKEELRDSLSSLRSSVDESLSVLLKGRRTSLDEESRLHDEALDALSKGRFDEIIDYLLSSQSEQVGVNQKDFIILEGRDHITYQYPDLEVAIHKLGLSPTVEALGSGLRNTAKERDGTPYIGSITHQQALNLNQRLGNLTLTPRQGIDLKLALEKALAGEKIYYADGSLVDNTGVLSTMHNEMFGVNGPWRGEHLDASFSKKGRQIQITYHKINPDGSVEKTTEPLEKCLMKDCYIDLGSCNAQGMPTREGKDSQFWYHPRENSVARFNALSDGAGLDCYGGSGGSDSSLGVRAARVKT